MYTVIYLAISAIIWIALVIVAVVLLRKSNLHLHKSEVDRKIFGVCGGLAETFGIDSTFIRLMLVVFTLFGGSGILVYILAAIIMPKDVVDVY